VTTMDPYDLTLAGHTTAPRGGGRGARMGRFLRGTVLLGLGAAAWVPLAPTPAAHAAVTFTVDRIDDPDPATAMACTDTPADCSLRGAIIAANGADGPDQIILPAGTYTLSRAGYSQDAATGDLNVTGDLTVTGAGARSTTVTGGAAPYDDRIFMVDSGVTAAMSGLTITGGKVPNAGGAIRSHGDLKLDRVAIKGNTVSEQSTGGGIYSEGPLKITNSTVSGNSADAYGGGVTQFAATATITNSTISGNKAGQFAGGVLAHSTTVTIRNSTIASNRSGGLGGGIKSVLATVVLRNTIVAGNAIDNCDTNFGGFDGVIRSQGNNLSSDGTCNLTEPTDKRNTTPRLGPLQNNGGATDTRALLAGSAALDGGVTTGCPTVDQRGVARPQGLRCDIGAFERRNHKPVARDDRYRASEDTTLRVAPRGVLRNDTDPDGDRLRASIANRPAKGQLTLRANGAFTYRPPRDFNGTVRFRYRASDAYGGRNTATVTIRIAARPR
jgi:hypothetical protein